MSEADDGSLASHDTLDELLEAHLPPRELAEARRVLYGLNQGQPVAALDLDPAAADAAAAGAFDLRAFRFAAAREQLRPPRLVRIGLAQHAIVLPTDAPFEAQRAAIFARVRELAAAAAAAGVQILCLQECFAMPFGFCTRERVWGEFAEDAATGPSVALARELAAEYSMVVVAPILERDAAHAETIWNTAVVVDAGGAVIGKHRKNHIPRVGDFNEVRARAEGRGLVVG